MDFRLTSAATATVYNAIGVGKENATSRRELCRDNWITRQSGTESD